jgi:hypothetical protein
MMHTHRLRRGPNNTHKPNNNPKIITRRLRRGSNSNHGGAQRPTANADRIKRRLKRARLARARPADDWELRARAGPVKPFLRSRCPVALLHTLAAGMRPIIIGNYN